MVAREQAAGPAREAAAAGREPRRYWRERGTGGTGVGQTWDKVAWPWAVGGGTDFLAPFPAHSQSPSGSSSAQSQLVQSPASGQRLPLLRDGLTRSLSRRVDLVAPNCSQQLVQLPLLPSAWTPLFWGSSSLAASSPAFAHRPPVSGLDWEETSVAPLGSRNGVVTSRCAGKRPAPPLGAARPSGSVGAGPPLPPQ